MTRERLPRSFYARPATEVAPELIPVYESLTERARAASGLAEAVR